MGFKMFAVAAASLLTPMLSANATPRAALRSTGFVYVATNETSGNRIFQYARSGTGALTLTSRVSTGGLGGSGNGVGALDPLGSQDSLVLTSGGSVVLVVDAGSNDVASLHAGAAGLSVASRVGSGGTFPNSLAEHNGLVYVLNAHGTPNIAGFRLDANGTLTALGSVQALPGASAAKPHDIRFSPDGTRLIVTDEGNNQIDVFEVANDGLISGIVSQPSAGSGPFGIRFGRGGVLLITEAGSASVSSYVLNPDDTVTVISPEVTNGQAASCWISLTGDGKFAFVSNTGSGTLSSYQVSGNGTLNLEAAVAASGDGGAPIDSALSSEGAFLYVVDSALGRLLSFTVNGASLTPLTAIPGLPTSIQGLAAQ